MPWIPHLMVVDDDPRVLDSLIPSFADDLGRRLGLDASINALLRRGEPAADGPGAGPIAVKVSAHGYSSDRVRAYRVRSPHQVHLHLVRESGGRFDLARRL